MLLRRSERASERGLLHLAPDRTEDIGKIVVSQPVSSPAIAATARTSGLVTLG